MGRWIRVMMSIVLVGVLTACGSSSLPSQDLVKKAIAMQARETQQELSTQLKLLVPKSALKIDRVTIASRNPVTVEGAAPGTAAYHLKGTYDFTLKLPSRSTTQQDNPFDVYVQRQSEGKTWRLLQQKEGEDGLEWVTSLIQ